MTNKLFFRTACLLLFTLSTAFTPGDTAFAQAANLDKVSSETAIKRTRAVVDEIIKAAYPELAKADIQLKTFTSEADYFRTIFSFKRFLFGQRMRYFISVNPRVFELAAPEAGIRAIIAHELGHVYDFHGKNRLRLFGLLRLSSKKYTAQFERRTDLQAIGRGYAEGLKAYRVWLYQHVPAKKIAEKKRNYFSPEEIEAIQIQLKVTPSRLNHWLKHVPLKLEEITAPP